MKAIVRNVLLAFLISTFAFFGARGGKQTKQSLAIGKETKQNKEFVTERQKETFTCLSVAFLAWALCFWRCSVINRRLNAEREYQRRFNEYMRNSSFNRHY